MNKDLKQGDKLKYTGKGFIGFDPNDTAMVFVSICEGLRRDYRVIYKGQEMIVSNTEVEKLKP